jgi:proliferating cell nuclear antigen PCNA
LYEHKSYATEVVDLNKKPEPKPEPVTAIALEAPPVVEPKPEPTPEPTLEPIPQEQPQPEPAPTPQDDAPTVTVVEPEKPKEPEHPSATAYFTCGDANQFKKLFDAMKLLVDEIIIKFDMDSLTVRQMDPSRCALFDCKIDKEVFEEWNVTKPGYCCFSAEEVKKIVFGKPLKKDTIIGVSVDGEHGRITFTLKDNRIRERSFPTLEASIEEIPTPKIVFNALYKITAKELAEDIDDIQKLSANVIFIGTQDAFEMKVEGDYARGTTTYKRGDCQLLDIELREESKAQYSLSYLKDFVDPTLCDIVLVQFATDMPMKVTMLSKFGELIYYLAPRIETD